MMDIDLKLAERVMGTIADAGIALRSQLELHSTLAGDLGVYTYLARGELAYTCILRFSVALRWTEVREWQTVADVVRSVQRELAAEAAR